MPSTISFLHKAIRSITAAIFILLQQGVIMLMAAFACVQISPWLARGILLLIIPMIWINIKTWKYIQRYGIINFFTALSDTSKIDVPKENRWYHQD